MKHWLLTASLVAGAATACATVAWAATPRATPIRFAPGTSGAEISGGVIRGERALYSLGARAGQTMSVRIAAAEDNAVFQIYAPGATPRQADGFLEVDGRALPGAGEGEDARRWSGKLPANGDYLIVVGGTRGNASYRLSVTIR